MACRTELGLWDREGLAHDLKRIPVLFELSEGLMKELPWAYVTIEDLSGSQESVFPEREI